MDTHADTCKNIFLLRKNGDALSLFHFTYPFIPRDTSQPFTPRHHFHFRHSLSHHFPSYLLSTLTPFPPFLLILFLLLFPSALGESALVVLHSLSPSYLLFFISLPLPSSLCENEVTSLRSHAHTCRLCHVPAEEFTSHLLPHSCLSSSIPSFAHLPIILLLPALSLMLLMSSLS